MPRDSGGSLQVIPGTSKPTYTSMYYDFAPAATATDFHTVTNPVGSGIVYVVTRIYVSASATAASTMDMYVYKRTTANTGGTAVTLTATPQVVGAGVGVISINDTNDVMTGTTALAYTANPASLGSGSVCAVGRIGVTAATGANLIPLDYQYNNRGSKPIVLRPGQTIALNFNGQTVPGGMSMYTMIEWVEYQTNEWN